MILFVSNEERLSIAEYAFPVCFHNYTYQVVLLCFLLLFDILYQLFYKLKILCFDVSRVRVACYGTKIRNIPEVQSSVLLIMNCTCTVHCASA